MCYKKIHMTSRPSYPSLYARAVARVKSQVKRWPSAYASGRVVQEYTRIVKALHGPRAHPYVGPKSIKTPLHTWFQEQWVDILTGLPCGSVRSPRYYPVCRPKRIASRLTPLQIVDAVTRKQRMKEKTTTYPSYFRG
jgi:hypothetical protein